LRFQARFGTCARPSLRRLLFLALWSNDPSVLMTKAPRFVLLLVLLLGSFQLGRLSERAFWPCRLRPVAALVAPLLGQEMPSAQLCELLLQLPRL
jgi:hypothetical protein